MYKNLIHQCLREFIESPSTSDFAGKGRYYSNAHLNPSVDTDNKSATTEKTKGFSPIGKNPYIKIPKIFR